MHVDRQVDAVLLFPLDLEQTVGEERLEIGYGVVGECTCCACARRRLYHRCQLMAPSRLSPETGSRRYGDLDDFERSKRLSLNELSELLHKPMRAGEGV